MADVVVAMIKRSRQKDQQREEKRLRAQLKEDYNKLHALYELQCIGINSVNAPQYHHPYLMTR